VAGLLSGGSISGRRENRLAAPLYFISGARISLCPALPWFCDDEAWKSRGLLAAWHVGETRGGAATRVVWFIGSGHAVTFEAGRRCHNAVHACFFSVNGTAAVAPCDMLWRGAVVQPDRRAVPVQPHRRWRRFFMLNGGWQLA